MNHGICIDSFNASQDLPIEVLASVDINEFPQLATAVQAPRRLEPWTQSYPLIPRRNVVLDICESSARLCWILPAADEDVAVLKACQSCAFPRIHWRREPLDCHPASTLRPVKVGILVKPPGQSVDTILAAQRYQETLLKIEVFYIMCDALESLMDGIVREDGLSCACSTVGIAEVNITRQGKSCL